ncbi:MAG: TlpA disulfide reductase family protein [Cyclobacteriaceae bacterium]
MKIVYRIVDFVKPWLGAILIVWILQLTGLLSSISFAAQSVILKTGLMNASVVTETKPLDFNYNFHVKDLNGKKVDFNTYKGKVIFLNLWATWCGPCRAEMPTIQNLYQKVSPNDQIEFVMLSIDKDKDLNKVVTYVADHAYTFPTYMPSGYLSEQLNIPSIPTTFIISKDGKILTKEVGTTNFDTKKFLNFLITEANK